MKPFVPNDTPSARPSDRHIEDMHFESLTDGLHRYLELLRAKRPELVTNNGMGLKAYTLHCEAIEPYRKIVEDPKRLKRFRAERLEPCARIRLVRPYRSAPHSRVSGADILFQRFESYNQKFAGTAEDGGQDRDLRDVLHSYSHVFDTRLSVFFERMRHTKTWAKGWFMAQPLVGLMAFCIAPALGLISSTKLPDLTVAPELAWFTGGWFALQALANLLVIKSCNADLEQQAYALQTSLPRLANQIRHEIKMRHTELQHTMTEMIEAAGNARHQAWETQAPKQWLETMAIWLDFATYTEQRLSAIDSYCADHDDLNTIIFRANLAEARHNGRFLPFWWRFSYLPKSLFGKLYWGLLLLPLTIGLSMPEATLLGDGELRLSQLALLSMTTINMVIAFVMSAKLDKKIDGALDENFADRLRFSNVSDDGNGPPDSRESHNQLIKKLSRLIADWVLMNDDHNRR